jgi:hypothetical protein
MLWGGKIIYDFIELSVNNIGVYHCYPNLLQVVNALVFSTCSDSNLRLQQSLEIMQREDIKINTL